MSPTRFEPPAAAKVTDLALGNKGQLIVRGVTELTQLATQLVKGLGLKITTEEAVGRILAGMEAGLPIIQSLSDVYLVNGRPTIYGDGVRALMLRSGLQVGRPQEHWEGEGLQRTAYCSIYRKGEEEPYEGKFSAQTAKNMGLIDRNINYRTDLDNMLMWRAYHRAVRKGFADVLRGLHIREIEEEDAAIFTESRVVENPAPGVRRSLSLRKPASEEGPPADATPKAPGVPAQAPPQEPSDPFVSSHPPGDGSPPAPPAFSSDAPGRTSHSPASSPEETGPEGELLPPTSEVPPAHLVPTAKDELRKLSLDLSDGKIPMARGILRRLSGNKWDSPLHPACTEEECQRVLEALREEWMNKKGRKGREPGSDG